MKKSFDTASIDKFILGGEIPNPVGGTYFHVVAENAKQVIEEFNLNYNSITKADIEECLDESDDLKSKNKLDDILKTFSIKGSLNKSVWGDGKTLNPKIRLRLLDISDDFIDYINIRWCKPKDVILTGSMANYNWSKYSDFDLHVIYDFDEIDKRTDFVKDFVDSKKNLWNETHDELNISGFTVELYVQNSSEKHTSSGVYSLYKNKWIIEPSIKDFQDKHIDLEQVSKKSLTYMKKLFDVFSVIKHEKDVHKIKSASKKLDNIHRKLKYFRRDSLLKYGEMSEGNIVYKVLRRMGYLDKIMEYKSKSYDKINSL